MAQTPVSLEAERSVLGAVLMDGTAIAKITDLEPDDFYSENNAAIYRACRHLFAKGEHIDLVTVSHALEVTGELTRIGGSHTIASIQEETPTSSNIESYAEIVKDKALKRRVIQAGEKMMEAGFSPTIAGRDAVAVGQRSIYDLANHTIESKPESMLDLVTSYVKFAQSINGSGITGIRTAFPSLDRLLHGMKPGELTYVAARPGMGKSALAMALAWNAARQGYPALFFSLEMSKESLVERMIAADADIEKPRLDEHKLSDNEWNRMIQASGRLGELPLYIDDQSPLDELTMMAKARQLVMQIPLKLIIVDYVQILRSSRDWKDNRAQEVGYLSMALKGLAKELRVPVIALSQLSRAIEHRENKRPQLADLRDSGSLEQDADVVIGMYREGYYHPDKYPQGTLEPVELLILKHRNGPTGKVVLNFERSKTRFEEK